MRRVLVIAQLALVVRVHAGFADRRAAGAQEVPGLVAASVDTLLGRALGAAPLRYAPEEDPVETMIAKPAQPQRAIPTYTGPVASQRKLWSQRLRGLGAARTDRTIARPAQRGVSKPPSRRDT